jgi:2-methylisocitrate lyase-like PEP mutase family enzyme
MANMVGGGKTPILSPEELEKIGYRIAAYPVLVFSAAIKAAQAALVALKNGGADRIPQVTFDELKTLVGFDDYYEREQRYSAE